MSIDNVMNQAKDKMSKTQEFYKRDMLSLRAGRANPQILDTLEARLLESMRSERSRAGIDAAGGGNPSHDDALQAVSEDLRVDPDGVVLD